MIKISGTQGLLQKLKDLETSSKQKVEEALETTAKVMAKKAQYKFNSAEYDGTNDVMCYSNKVSNFNSKSFSTWKVYATSPSGSVAFIEFGAGNGKMNTNTKDHPFRQTAIPPISEIGYYSVENNVFNPRWNGSRGKDDFWIFKNPNVTLSKTTKNFSYVVDKNGKPRPNVYWTGGNKPARAMWSAHLYFTKHFEDNLKGVK